MSEDKHAKSGRGNESLPAGMSVFVQSRRDQLSLKFSSNREM
jgi:hypothetical protein